eukprot:scaffold1583_cov95-Phaeocystis_antarctica.AAC.1
MAGAWLASVGLAARHAGGHTVLDTGNQVGGVLCVNQKRPRVALSQRWRHAPAQKRPVAGSVCAWVDRPKGVAGDDLRLVAKHFVPHDHVAAANEGRRGCPVVLDARSHLGQCGGEDIAPPTDHSVVEDHLVRVAVEQAVVARLLVHRVHAVRTKIER